MRLTSISLVHYGNFESERIEFDPRPGAINLLMAPNGAGKSVLRSAFCDLLFGIGGQSPMGFRFGYSSMRIVAEAVVADSTSFKFGRRKGQGNTLVDDEGNLLDPVTLNRIRGNADRTLLERFFALDTERLRKGEEELYESNGALRDALLSSAGGFRRATQVLESLQAARDALAPTRKSSLKPFYIELDKYNEARKQLAANLLRPDRWKKEEEALSNARNRREEQNRRVESASATIARLERVRRVAPWLDDYDTAADWLAAHPEAPILEPSLAKRLADARAAVVLAEERMKREMLRAQQLAEQAEPISPDVQLLAASTNIEELTRSAGAAQKALADLPGVESELAVYRTRIAALLRDLGSPLPLEQAAEVIPPLAALARVRRLVTGYHELVAAKGEASRRVADLQLSCDDLAKQLAASPLPIDIQNLADLSQECRSEGDPARRRRELAGRSADAKTALEAALRATPGWTGNAEQLVDLAPLLPGTYDRLAADLAAAKTEEINRRSQLDAAQQALAEAKQRCRAIVASQALPTYADLNDARARREVGWTLIYRRAFTADPPSDAEEEEFSAKLPLPIAYQQSVSAADSVADERMQHATAIAEVDAARRVTEDAEAALTHAAERYRVALEASAAVERSWSQVCSIFPLGPNPNLAEVHVFLAARERVIEARRLFALANDALQSLDERHRALASRLAIALGSTEPELPTLTHLLSTADRAIDAAKKTAADRTRLIDRYDSASASLAKEKNKVSAVEAQAELWREDWKSALTELGRPLDEEPETTSEILQLFADLKSDCETMSALLARVNGMRADVERFNGSVSSLAASLGLGQTGRDPFDTVSELARNLQHHRGLERQRKVLNDQLETARKDSEAAERALAERQAELRATLTIIGAESADAAEIRLHMSAERELHAARFATAQTRLRDAGDGLPLEQLRTEVMATPLADIEGTIALATRERKDASDVAQEAAAEASRLDQQMARERVANEVGLAAVQRESATAKMGRVLDEALLLHAAAALLDKSLSKVETVGDSVLLKRISELFRKLTHGIYARVYTEVDDNNVPRLILQESAFPDERKSVRELSEGTRDQLYLALRLAAIEEYAATLPPLPFIGDDILQTFDDDRAIAAMRVLVDLSQSVQVILLTHHRHLLDLASQLPNGAVNVCRLRQLLPA